MKEDNNEERYLVCQKYSKKLYPSKEKIKCFAPEKPCKFRLDCPIYIMWKNG